MTDAIPAAQPGSGPSTAVGTEHAHQVAVLEHASGDWSSGINIVLPVQHTLSVFVLPGFHLCVEALLFLVCADLRFTSVQQANQI